MEEMKIRLNSRLKNKKTIFIIAVFLLLVALIIALGVNVYNKEKDYKMASENVYNMSFYELVNSVDEIETYLAKAEITSTAEHAVKTLSHIWNKANLSVVYLGQIPIKTEGLSNSEKFLNQLSDYSYSLSMKAAGGENLSDEDLKHLEELHRYSVDLRNTLRQLESEINDGSLDWGEIAGEGSNAFAQQVSSDISGGFGNIETTFDEYTGLIYDGAFSEHMVSAEKKGLTGDEIDEKTAREIAKKYTGANDENIENKGFSENGNIPSYNFEIKMENDGKKSIGISKKGGHIVYMNYYREVSENKLTPEQAIEERKKFLTKKRI